MAPSSSQPVTLASETPNTAATTANILTQDTVADYVSKHASRIGLFPSDAVLAAEAILGGNVNFAFVVREPSSGKSVFVKQAPEYVAIFGPDGMPLTSKRIQREVAVINEWCSILGDDKEKYIPRLYYFDETNKVFVMEFLEGYTLLDHDLVTKSTLQNSISSGLGKFMGKTHASTHASKVSTDRAAVYAKEYENRELRDIQLEFVFTKAYVESTEEQRAGLEFDDAFMAEINTLKARYNADVGDNFALCHGDLHPGSVMVNDVGQLKIIDPEFTVYGPPGLDVGSLLSGYILAAVHQTYCHERKAVDSIREGCIAVWEAYKSVMLDNGISEEVLREIEVETVGYAVAEVCRTALGCAGLRLWLQFDDKEVKKNAVCAALSIVGKCIKARHEGGIQILFDSLDALSI